MRDYLKITIHIFTLLKPLSERYSFREILFQRDTLSERIYKCRYPLRGNNISDNTV
ncbi:hypothetical protein [European catfish virus]|uniref:Uncharacterized protein n=1 Tax=European catfish virus TaxID=84739 RepID=I2BFM5_9VIRU|nr:hypothetical protein A190_gp045 [European catfish virus]AFJ52328.1 hypothetical protein [European catfish virus]AMZ04874.1 hypothetical protein [European catfish virus]AMZ05010.1 hypothetical protein [European catfish virus]